MKKKIFSIIISVIIFSFTYFLFGLWGIFEVNKNYENLFKTKKSLLFHKKYSSKLHHLRDSNRWGEEENDYLFSIISEDESYQQTLLIQGDSWIEQISESPPSKSMLKKFSDSKRFNTINAGITSFAPSLMHVQYKILKKDFKILPNNLIIYIDQTDIGDELCRYKHNIIENNDGTVKSIKRESKQFHGY